MKVLGDKIPKLAVIIPNYNGQDFLGQCLDSLSRQSFRDFEVIMVDNGSSDQSIALAERHPLKPRVIRLQRNLGFSAAVNAGMNAASAQLIALLNNDAEADSKWLETLLTCAKERPEMDFFAALVLKDKKRDQVESAGVGYNLQCRPFPIFAGLPRSRPQKAEIFLASGAAVLFKKTLVQKIGQFDPAYFAYLEDVDFFLRARLAGCRGMLCPDAVVYHRAAATELGDRASAKRMDSSQRVFLISRNRWRLVWDNLPAGMIVLLWPLICLGWLRGLAYHLFQSGQPAPFLAGSAAGFFSLPRRLEKPRGNKTRAMKNSELLRWMRKAVRELK